MSYWKEPRRDGSRGGEVSITWCASLSAGHEGGLQVRSGLERGGKPCSRLSARISTCTQPLVLEIECGRQLTEHHGARKVTGAHVARFLTGQGSEGRMERGVHCLVKLKAVVEGRTRVGRPSWG